MEPLLSNLGKKILLAAHRGASGGNIPCNTLAAYEIALRQGADMLETDVDISSDGVLVVFHPEMEPNHLCLRGKLLTELTHREIKELRYVNYDNTPTQFGIPDFDDFLEQFKDRCYINVDKFWGNPEAIYRAIKRHGMTEQIVVKSAPDEKVFRVLTDLAPDLAYLPIVKREHPLHRRLSDAGIRYVGAEVLFDTDDDPVCSPDFISMMHREGKLVWGNAIIYNYREQLSAGPSDDTSLCEDPALGWGWLADRGFDIIQTDWTLMAAEYLDRTGRRKRNG